MIGARLVRLSIVFTALILLPARPAYSQPGTLEWTVPTDAIQIGVRTTGGVLAPAIGPGGTIYASALDGKLYAVSSAGEVLWTYTLGGTPYAPPAIAPDGTIYANAPLGAAGKLTALNPDGTLRWSIDVDSGFAPPTLGAAGTIYLATGTALEAINPDGTRLWTLSPGVGGYDSGPVVVGADGTIYAVKANVSTAGGSYRSVAAIDPGSETKWTFIPDAGFSILLGAIGEDGSILFGTESGKIYSLSPDGDLQWVFESPDSIVGAPCIAEDGSILVPSFSGLHAINPDGSSRWTFRVDEGFSIMSGGTAAVGDDGMIYLGASGGGVVGRIYAINSEGSPIWSLSHLAEASSDVGFLSSPTLGEDGTLYIGSGYPFQHLVALETSSGGLADTPWPMYQQGPQHQGRAVAQPGVSLTFAQFASGKALGKENTTRVILRNNGSTPDSGRVRFRGSHGGEQTLLIGGQEVEEVEYSIDPWGSFELRTDGTDSDLKSGVIEVVSDFGKGSRVEGTEVFGVLGHYVSVNQSQPRSAHQTYVSLSSEENTGLALYNPSAEESAELQLTLISDGGSVEANQNLILGPGEQLVAFVDEDQLFGAYLKQQGGDFHGTLHILTVGGQKIDVLGLIQKTSNGALVAVDTSARVFSAAPLAKTAVRPPGTELWSVPTDAPLRTIPAIGDDGTIYFGTGNDSTGKEGLHALNPNGSIRWTYVTPGEPVTPAIGEDGTIYTGTSVLLYALAPDGSEKWHYQVSSGYIQAPPAISDNGSLYLATSTGNLLSMSPDGELQWQTEIGTPIKCAPVIGEDGTIYVVPFGDVFHAFNPEGVEVWNLELPVGYTSPSLGENGTIYVPSRDDGLYAVAPDGTLLWHFKAGGPLLQSVTIGLDGTLYFSAFNRLFAVDPDGNEKWNAPYVGTGGTAVAVDGTIYLGASTALWAFDPSGAVRWRFLLGANFSSGAPSVGRDGTLYFGVTNTQKREKDRFYAVSGVYGGLADSPWPTAHQNRKHQGRAVDRTATSLNAVFPQFANGELSGFENTSRVILRNGSGQPDTGKIRFSDKDGQPAPVPILETARDRVDYSTAAWGTFDLKTDGTGPLQSGVIEVESVSGLESQIEGSEVFGLLGNYVSVNSAPLRRTHQAYVSVAASEDTGLAFYNPDRSSEVTAQVTLLDHLGVELATKTLTLQPRQQIVAFVTSEELFNDSLPDLSVPFQGTVNINVFDGRKLAVLGLVQKRATGALIAVATSPTAFIPSLDQN